jgi:hypothetical protein
MTHSELGGARGITGACPAMSPCPGARGIPGHYRGMPRPEPGQPGHTPKGVPRVPLVSGAERSLKRDIRKGARTSSRNRLEVVR